MPNGQPLELVQLPAMHPPCGIALRHAFGPPTVIRLSIDPTPQPLGTISRGVVVDQIARARNAPAVEVQRSIGWANLQDAVQNLRALLVQLPITVNAQALTEQAAIGVMALLLHDLEGVVLQAVLQIGSGGDYIIQSEEQVEVSGIRHAVSAAVSQGRLAEKSTQVLRHSEAGYVSVTTFSYPGSQASGPIVHSYLHFVRQAPKKQKSRQTGKNAGKKGKKK